MSSKMVWIETYGCQMNKAESEAILLDLARDGWAPSRSEEEADLVILNTCSVRETAEERIRGRLGHYRSVKRGRPFTLALMGCMAERLGETIVRDFPEVDVIAGTFHKADLVSAVSRSRARKGPVILTGGEEYTFASLHSSDGPKAFVPIMHGCNNFCSYCIVPYVRGREVSRSPEDILDEILRLESRGVREVTLLGQNVNSYRFEQDERLVTFPQLLESVSRRASAVRWIRFLTSHPRDLSPQTIQVLASSPLFCRHVHLPVQCGSDAILERMNRGYTAAEFRQLVSALRSALTGVSITTDILIGFPGESERDFQDTIRLMEEVGFDDAFMYYYNPREGTPAYRMADALTQDVKLARLADVIATQRRITRRRMRERLGKEVEVLVEGVSRRDDTELLARTEWDGMVVFPGDPSRIGSFARVRLEETSGNTYKAVPV